MFTPVSATILMIKGAVRTEHHDQSEKRQQSFHFVLFPVALQETDYVMSYFDNGEEFGGDSDDNMDEAIY